MAGQTLTYTLTITNNGPDGASGATLTDTLPAGVTFQSISGGCTQAGGTVTCTIGNLANGAAATVEIKVTPQSEGTITNSASVESNDRDLNTANNVASAQTTVQLASTTGCKITDGGRIEAADGDKATFGANAQVSSGGSPKGQQEYQDHGPAQPMNVKSTGVSAITCSADRKQASIFGTAKINGSGSFSYEIDVQDLGEPGVGTDTYRITLSNGYGSRERNLDGGNIQIHK